MQPALPPPLTASDLFALSQGGKNAGPERCHWCGSACERTWLHDDAPAQPFRRSTSTARNLGGHFICLGCWLWRRKRQTVRFLGGGLRDVQEACWHGWWVTEKGAWTLRAGDSTKLMELLADPPHRFCCALLDGVGNRNLLQLMAANDYSVMRADDGMTFTVNGTPFRYTTHELKAAVNDGTSEGPGVAMLFRLLGRPAPRPKEVKKEGDKGGRPPPGPDGRETVRVIKRSGQRETATV